MLKNTILLAFAVFILQGQVRSAAVSQQTAQTTALNFFRMQNAAANGGITAALQYTRTETSGAVDFYVFNISPGPGFVVVSGDNSSTPILAYSSESIFNPNCQRVGLSDWINHTAQKISYTVNNGIQADPRTAALWHDYIAGTNPNVTRSAVIGPLLTTTWNQEPYYNSLCPSVSPGNQCVTGCVATTMAQILKYWSYPRQGADSFSYVCGGTGYQNSFGTLSANFGATVYNWAAMPANVTSNTSPVDSLMYQCGVSVAMDYGDDSQGGSGALVLEGWGNPPCAEYSYVNYFLYNPNTIQGVHFAQYTTSDWINMMESELNAGRVIQYAGDDPNSGGHTWVCDGYDVNGLLHMNWGWGGASDGYFSVGDLNAGGYTFSQNDAALIGIQPMYPFPVNLTATHTSICSGGNTNLTAQGPSGATYSWSPSLGLSCTGCATPVASPSSTTLYTVTVDSGGVTSTSAVAIMVMQPPAAHYSFVAYPSCTLPELVSFRNSSTAATAYTWDFGDGAVSSIDSAGHYYNWSGTFEATLVASNACFSDTLVQTINVTSGPPLSLDQSVCRGDIATLGATSTGAIAWYDSTMSSTLATGSSFTTPALNTTTSYYVSSTISFPVLTVGAVTTSIGTSSSGSVNDNVGMTFNCTVAQNLQSIDVYSASVSSPIIVLEDNGGNILDSQTVHLPIGHKTLQLNWSVPAGNGMNMFAFGPATLYSNSAGASYPYTSNDGTITITGNTPNSTSDYYYFYNWKFQQYTCTTGFSPVTAFVLNSGGAGSFTAAGNGSPTVTFTPSDMAIGTSYVWEFGDGSGNSTLQTPTHTYPATGVYHVQLIVSNGTCSDTLKRSISTIAAGIQDITGISAMDLYPNPAQGMISFSFSSDKELGDCQATIFNTLGQTQSLKTVNVKIGANNVGFDVSPLAAGIYFVSLNDGKQLVTARFVKE